MPLLTYTQHHTTTAWLCFFKRKYVCIVLASLCLPRHAFRDLGTDMSWTKDGNKSIYRKNAYTVELSTLKATQGDVLAFEVTIGQRDFGNESDNSDEEWLASEDFGGDCDSQKNGCVWSLICALEENQGKITNIQKTNHLYIICILLRPAPPPYPVAWELSQWVQVSWAGAVI